MPQICKMSSSIFEKHIIKTLKVDEMRISDI